MVIHRFVGLTCGADYYSLCIKPEKFHTVERTPWQVRHYSLSQPGFSSTALIFSLACKMWLQLHKVIRLLPPSCLSTHDTADTVSGYFSNGEWQQSVVNKEDKWERWVLCRNLWLISDLSAELISWWVSHCVSETESVWDCCKVNKWTCECSVI